MPHLPLPRAFDVRRAALPHAGARSRHGSSATRSSGCAPGWPDNHLLTDGDAARIEADVAAEIDDAVAFAEAGTLEPVEDLERFVLMDAVVQERAELRMTAAVRMTYREACRQAIRDALLADPRMLPDGRGRRQLRRLLRGDQGAARGVRPGAHLRHAAGRERLRRRGHRRGDRGAAADRRDHDLQLQPARARPDHEQRGHDLRTCRAGSSPCRW